MGLVDCKSFVTLNEVKGLVNYVQNECSGDVDGWRVSRGTQPCAPAKRGWLKAPPPRNTIRGGYGQAFPGSFENSQEMPAVASGWRGKE